MEDTIESKEKNNEKSENENNTIKVIESVSSQIIMKNDNKNGDDDDNDDLEDGEIDDDEEEEEDDDEPIIIGTNTTIANSNSSNGNNSTATTNSTSATLDNDTGSLTEKNDSENLNSSSSKSIIVSGSSNINASNKIDLTINDKLNSSKSLLNVPTNKKSKGRFIDDDWAGNIENAIAAALKKEGVILPKIERERERDRESLHSDDGGVGGDGDSGGGVRLSRGKAGKKRKKRESDKKSKKKIKHHNDQNDEIDDYEMLCIRGGSPPPLTSAQIHHHHHHHHSHPPHPPPPPPPPTYYDSDNSYTSYDSYDSQEYKNSSYQERRQIRKIKDRRRKANDRDTDTRKRGGGGNEKRKRNNDDRDDGGVCIPNMRGYCPNGDDCPRSHDCRAQRKLELCKFYLMECCAKKDKCSYMHSDFPCKYYYLGMECIYKGACKFSHGKPLTDQLRNILLKHIETAPKEILGDFRRISREHAITLLNATHAKLCAEQGIENTLAPSTSTTTSLTTVNSNMMQMKSSTNRDQLLQSHQHQQQQNVSTTIPSLLDIVIKPPIPSPRKDDGKLLVGNTGTAKGEKQRKSRWCDTASFSSSSVIGSSEVTSKVLSNSSTLAAVPDVLSLRNLTGVITQEQIEKLAAMGIENLEQVNQLTVAQLNSLGLTISQINEIQLNALNIQKLGLIKSSNTTIPPLSSTPSYLGNLTTTSSSSSSSSSPSSTLPQSTSPSAVAAASSSPSSTMSNRQSGSTLEFVNPGGLYSDPTSLSTQDIDMRFLIGGTTTADNDRNQQCSSPSSNTKTTTTMTLVSTGIASPDAIQPARTIGSSSSGINYGVEKSNDIEMSSSSSAAINSTNSIDYSQYLKDSNLDADKTDLNDISLDKDDGLNEDEPELLIDESWMDPNDEEKDSNSKNDQNDDETMKNDENSTIPKLSSPDMWNTETITATMLRIPSNLSSNQAYKAKSYYRPGSDEENWDSDDEMKRRNDDDDDDDEGNSNMMSLTSGVESSREFRGDPRLHKTQQQTIGSFGDYLGTTNTGDSMYNNTSNDNWLSSTTATASDYELSTASGTKYQRTSIYDGNPSDTEDGDDNSITRKKYDKDMRMSSFIDSTTSDVDLRLPFKPVMTNYTPATEIDGSISSHGPIPYKVVEIEIPKPDYREIRRSIPVSEKTLDPRLRKIFCLKESTRGSNELGSSGGSVSVNQTTDLQFSCNRSSSNTIGSNTSSISSNLLQKRDELLGEKTSNVGGNIGGSSNGGSSSGGGGGGPRADPRRRKESQDNMLTSGGSGSGSSGDKSQGVDIRLILQKSNWYKNLNSKFKIMVNQQLALVSTELKKFHQDTSPNKVFDMSFIANNQYLQQILTNLCIFIDSNGQIKQLEGDNDGDGTSSMPGIGMGLGGMSGMDPNVVTSVQQMVGAGAGLVMPPVNGPAQLTAGILSTMPGAAAGMYMRNAPPLMSQFRPQRYENIRPGLLGIAPGIQFNPYDMKNAAGGNVSGSNMAGINETNDSGGYVGGGGDEQNNFNAFLGSGGGSGGGSLFDQSNFFGRPGNDGNLQSSNNRGMRNNFRQGSGGGSGGRNQNDRWNTGGSGGGNRDGNSRRNFEGKNRGGGGEARRDKIQKS